MLPQKAVSTGEWCEKATHGELAGPMMVETHSKRLSPFGPAEQLHGGSRLISASSFWILKGAREKRRKEEKQVRHVRKWSRH